MLCPPDLRKRYQSERLIPFVGAGVSMSVRWRKDGADTRGPSWSELVDRAAQLLGFEDPQLVGRN